MEELTERLKKVEIAPCDSLPIAHPFHPPAKYGINSEVPRYLFRVYSPSSAGDNSVEGFTSEDGSGPKGNLTDIFARSPEAVAISLNEHLRWSRPRSRRDPFISWTSSMAFALHYAIYKSKEEGVGLGEIMLCVIDTTKFPPGTFMQDLSLVKMFESRVRASELITVYGTLETWGAKGLGDFLDLRTARKRRGVYYFGEYLSQGRTYVAQGRSSTVSIDKIIDADIFQIAPQLQREAMSTTKGRFQRSRWADAVLDLRQDFHKGHDPASQLNSKQREAGRHIAFQFSSQFTVPVLANLLSLRPLWTNITIGTAILQCDPGRCPLTSLLRSCFLFLMPGQIVCGHSAFSLRGSLRMTLFRKSCSSRETSVRFTKPVTTTP